MRSCWIFLCFCVETLAYGQGFNRRYDPFGWGFAQESFGVEMHQDGYLVISGSIDYDSIGVDLWFNHVSVVLLLVDQEGNSIWEKRSWRPWHNAFTGWANCCDTIPGGGYVVGGTSEDTAGVAEVYLMRFDAQGDTLWTRVFGGPTNDHYWAGRQVKRTPDGGFLIVGDMGYGNIFANGIDGFAIRTDSMGNELWTRTYGEPPPDWRGLLSCALAPAGDLYMAGTREVTEWQTRHWVMRTDAFGEPTWDATWGGDHLTGALQVIAAVNGDPIVFSGNSYAPDFYDMRPYIARLDATDGGILWEREYGPLSYGTVLFAGKECPNGDLIAAGAIHTSIDPWTDNGLMLRTTATGDSLWMFNYFYTDSLVVNGQGRFYDVLPTPDGGFIAVGVTYNPPGGPLPPGYSQDTWVVKVDSLGCIVPGCNSVGIHEQATNLLDALTLYPNPAQAQVTVRLTLPPQWAHHVLQLSLVGMDGRVVHQQMVTGNGEHVVPLHHVAAGLYTVHLVADGQWLSGGKLVVE